MRQCGNFKSLASRYRITSYNVCYTKLLRLLRSGTTLSLSFENQRLEANTALSLFNPEYTTALTLSAHHPLLKGSGKLVTEAPLAIARAGAEAVTGDWLAMVMDVVAGARTSFLSYNFV